MVSVNDYSNVAVGAVNKHKGLLLSLANKELSRQLKVCTSTWLEWRGGNDKPALFYADFAEMAWLVAYMHQDMDHLAWAVLRGPQLAYW